MNLVALSTAASNEAIQNEDRIVNSVGNMAEILDKYGGYIVILAVFILVFILAVITIIYLNNKMMKASLEEKLTLLNSQRSQNEKLVDHILKEDDDQSEEKSSNDDSETHKKDLVGTYIDVNLILKDAVRTALNELDAERVAIYVFHNGNQSIHGLPFFKATCIHEWNKLGSVAMKTRPYRSITHHSIPLYLLSGIVEDIYNTKKFYINEVQKKKDKLDYLQTFLEHSDIESIYAIAIADDSETIAGFVIAEFKDIINFEDHRISNRIQRILETTRDTVKPVVINLNGKYSISHEHD